MEPRYLGDVIDEVLKVLNDNEYSMTVEGYEDLKADLERIKISVAYAAPESLSLWWEQFMEALNVLSFPPKLPWEKAIYKIVTLKDFDEEQFAAKDW